MNVVKHAATVTVLKLIGIAVLMQVVVATTPGVLV